MTSQVVDFKIGFGFDVHQLKEGKVFILGGIKVPHSKGAIGHSDADVLIHAICDSILGALNLGDIGSHFPDNSKEYKGIDSKILLKRVINLMLDHKYEIGNIDTTICLQKPKINTYIAKMKEVLAKCMMIQETQISIKATTTESLGFVGNEKGVSAYATVLIRNKVL